MLLLALMAQAALANSPCHYDRAAALKLDQDAFDQDMTGGWRKLEDDDCEAEAADLVRDWRIAHASTESILFWHEGQLRADIGQTENAVSLFRKSYKPAQKDRIGWNYYVEGTIAFLVRDRTAFQAAKARLAGLKKPADFTFTGPDGQPLPVQWPLNMNVLEGFERCWDQPYKAAYACATPMRIVRVPDKNSGGSDTTK